MKRSRPSGTLLLDGQGQMLAMGDRAVLVYIDRLYLYGLTTERQDPYEAQLDREVLITDMDDTGNVAIQFEDGSGVKLEYWIEPRWLRRQPL
jgi:hypothetical protein